MGNPGQMSTLTLFLIVLCCDIEETCADACNDTALRLVNGSDLKSSAPDISESAWGNSSSTWMPISSGRVEVCWGGEWRGLLHGSIRTTRQLELICQEVGFLPEGAEICEGAHDENYTDLVHCWLDVAGDNLTVHNCSNATSLQQTCNMASNFINLDTAAVIKCKTLSEFSPQDIALMVLCPLSFLLISALVVVTLRLIQVNLRVKTRAQNQPKVIKKLNLKTRAQKQPEMGKKPNRVQVTTRKCVAYEACTLERDEEIVRFRSNLEASVAAKTRPCDAENFGSMHMEPNYDEVRDIFEMTEVTLKARSRSLEHLPLKPMGAGKGYVSTNPSPISRKPPLLPKPGSLVRSFSDEWDGDFRAGRKESGSILKPRIGMSLPRNIRKAPPPPPPPPPQQCVAVPFAECSTMMGSGSKSHGSPGGYSRHFELSAQKLPSRDSRQHVVGVVMERSEECEGSDEYDESESGGYVRVDTYTPSVHH